MYKNKIIVYFLVIFCCTSCLSPSKNKNNFNCETKIDFNKEIEANYSNSLSKSLFAGFINNKRKLDFDTLFYEKIKIVYIYFEVNMNSYLNSRIICINDTSFFVINNNPINDNRVRFHYNDNGGNFMSKDSSFLIIDSSIFYENRVLNEILYTLNSNNTSIDEVLDIIRIVKYSSRSYKDEINMRFEPILVQHSNLLNFIIRNSFLENCRSAIIDDTFSALFEYSNKFDDKNTIMFYNPEYNTFDIFALDISRSDGRYFLSKQYTILPPCLSAHSPL